MKAQQIGTFVQLVDISEDARLDIFEVHQLSISIMEAMTWMFALAMDGIWD